MESEQGNKSSIDFLRHGETTAGKCFLGSTDTALNSRGWSQMLQAGLKEDYDLIISSPLARCREFAVQFAKQKDRPYQIETDFREIDFGKWEAKTSDELWKTEEKLLSAFWNDPVTNTPPKGEALLEFQTRVIGRYYSLLDESQGKNILLVCHAGVIKIILCNILGVELKNMHKMSIDHGGVSQVSMWQKISQVNFINNIKPVD